MKHIIRRNSEPPPRAAGWGSTGPPFFFIGTRAISGAQPLETFQQIIAQEKAKAS